MLFGLCNAPAIFQTRMTVIFTDSCENFFEFFMDDFSIYGTSFGCLHNLDIVLRRCEETSLVLNWEKYLFMVKDDIVLGHKISQRVIKVDKAKVDAIRKMHYPKDIKGIRSFLGHVGFYRRFIKDLVRSLDLLLIYAKGCSFCFYDDYVEGFGILKNTFDYCSSCSTTVLKFTL
ncbi:reverse transcriptase [Hordeum vulgare]|nr:reverse transcriptase [Hordeum vulgare]